MLADRRIVSEQKYFQCMGPVSPPGVFFRSKSVMVGRLDQICGGISPILSGESNCSFRHKSLMFVTGVNCCCCGLISQEVTGREFEIDCGDEQF